MKEDEASLLEPARAMRGVFSGFERYTTPGSEDYKSAMRAGLIVFDTNALLNLYRYTGSVRSALLDVMTRVSDNIWEPDQVMLEFWRRRESAIRDYEAAGRDFSKSIESAKHEALTAVRALSNRIGLNEEQKKALVEPLDSAYKDLIGHIHAIMSADGESGIGRNTATDPVLRSLSPILHGRVGMPSDAKAHEAAIAEARRRISAKQPPGYMDSSKGEGRAEGDYLVWSQILEEARARSCDVLFVTGDVKEDWWRRWGGVSTAGPRYELLDEFHAVVGKRFYMLQPADFLATAGSVLDVAVSSESVAQARRLDEDSAAHLFDASYATDVIDALWELVVSSQGHIRGGLAAAIGVDFEITRSVSKMGVIIKSAPAAMRPQLIIDHVNAALALGYAYILIVTNSPVTENVLAEISHFREFFALVTWRDPGDNQELYAAVRRHLP